ncbi:hypothetical protein F2Q68_00034489 [Brassica cretica]|uniref:Uncharacterized protein n=1 Tax=Brassica cretica TaxID=69181 RepID=A0A8S9H2K9_BRACR|nr:hypothetical protein F2Q68_00034489 [Brassica cretica]
MRTESGPDSSSIGSRVRSNRLRVVPTESMDSSDSSLDLTVAVKNPKVLITRNTSSAEGSQYPPIDPPSVIRAEEVAIWRKKYNLPDDVVIRAPEPGEVVSDFGVDEVPVYEGYFASGFRDHVPSLIPKNLGDIYGFVIGVAEVLFSYSVVPLNSADWRYYLHPLSKEPPVREVPKKERKKLLAFEGNWTEKFAFSHLLDFSATWQLEDLPRVDYSSGRDTIEQVSKLPLECRQVSFLVSEAALKRCSVWGEMSGSKGDEALAEYKKALEVMSAKKAAPKQAISTEDDEVQFIGSNKRRAGAAAAPSSYKKKSKVSGSSPKDSPSVPYDWTTVLNNLNTKVFPSTPVLLASEEDSSTAIRSLQGDLLEVASQLHYLGERMESAVSTKVEMDNLTSQLRKEKDAALAKDKEIKELKLKVKNQEEAGELAATENTSLWSQLKEREEELIDLKDTAATFDVDKTMAVNGAKVVARWELMREWLNGQTDSLDPVTTLEQHKMVKITEAEFLGLPPPSFEHEPKIPGGEEKKTPEPSADDPPPN